MVKRLFGDVFDLSINTDVDKTVNSISEGVHLRGYNIWILICSVFLASIGLDVNSAAVIIGAMLISPLMSPILGIGLSLGIHDRELFVKSLKNLGLATLLSLGVSAMYFFVTPFGDITSELLARTSPTLLDVMVAFFGGVAGIVSSSRSQVTNAIPGVAIATALMPPLCTAGYGLASGHWEFFLGAFYLFFINAVFIALSTFLIVKYLKFPIKQYVDKTLQRRYTRWSGVFVTLALLPSIYFLYTVYTESRGKKTVETLVINALEKEGNEVLKWDYESHDSVKLVNVYYSGVQLEDSKLREMEALCRVNGLDRCRINALRVNLTKEEVTGLTTDAANDILNQWQIKMVEKQREDSAYSNNWKTEALRIEREVVAGFSFIDSVVVGKTVVMMDTARTDTFMNLWYRRAPDTKAPDLAGLAAFLRQRMQVDTVVIQDFYPSSR